MKKFLSVILILALMSAVFSTVFADEIASQKEEVVYGILDLDGSAKDIYVVNIFEDNNIVDYGNYTKVRNMTTSEKVSQNGDRININTSADRLYYEGIIEKRELPWGIDIEYILDNKKISGAELAGKSGVLEIKISVNRNPEVNSTFFDNYTLQIALSLDTKLARNIKSDNATVAEAGSKKQLMYTVLPGQGANISVTADVRDFEADAITINGIRMNLGMVIDEEEFSDQISRLINAIKELDGGAEGLLKGVTALSDGMDEYVEGLKAFKNGLSELGSGVGQLDQGVKGISAGLSELSDKKGPLLQGASMIQGIAFNEMNERLSAMNLGLPSLTLENYEHILKDIPELASVKTQLDGMVQFTDGLKAYTDGVTELSLGASELAKGTSKLNSSMSEIPKLANDLYNGGAELNSAIKQLKAGLAEYRQGTNKLRSSTSNIDVEISNTIDEIMGNISGDGDEVVSFVSDKNTNVSSVQFIMKTEEIKVPEIDVIHEEPGKLSFWGKLLNLFKLNR